MGSRGVGLAFMAEETAAPHLASRALVRVPAALLALVETLRL
jgi:hypothetical protein